MFLRCKKRHKDGKEHLYWSIVENRRVMGGRIPQRPILYLGELNGRQETSWRKTVELFAQDEATPRQVSLFPEEHLPIHTDSPIPNIGIRLSHMRLERPRQWGACWLACELWKQLGLDTFWLQKLPPGRQGTRWDLILQTLVLYRLIDPGSEWRLHRQWFDRSAIADLLGNDFSLVEIHRLYQCHDQLLEHKTTLADFLRKIENQYGKAERIWIMDRGIPTEDALRQMRQSNPPVSYLVGTPKGRFTTLEHPLLEMPWHHARPRVKVKILPHDGETYVLAQSQDRIAQERSMRRRRLRKYIKTLAELTTRKRPIKRDDLHQALGAAKKAAGRDARHVKIQVTHHGEGKTQTATLIYQLDRRTLRIARRREGRYLLRANIPDTDPVKIWEYYLQLTEIEQAFKELKGDLAIRPIHHQLEERVKAHIFISFLSYCLQVTLKARLRRTASGLTPRSVLEKFAAVQMLDVHLPTTDGREIVLTRHTQPDKDLQILLHQLQLTLPEQAPPKIQAPVPPSN